MKTTLILLALAATSAFAQTPILDGAPLLDAPGPGYRGEPDLTEQLRVASPPLPRPVISMTQAATIADRELHARALDEDFAFRAVTFVRAPQIADSFYIAVLSPLSSSIVNKHREFRINMKGTITFHEGDSDSRKTAPR